MEIILSLGSNLGDRLSHLRTARDGVAALPGVRVVAQAPVYETEPVGVKPEYRNLRYLNTVLVVETDRPVGELHGELMRLENESGRVRGEDRFAPRPLDIDVLFAGDTRHETGRLSIPHPRWAERRFVVQPLADVRPHFVIPGTRETVRDVLLRLPPGEGLALYARAW